MAEVDEVNKYWYPEGIDGWAQRRSEFILKPRNLRVADLQALDQHLTVNPRRSREYSSLDRRARELRAIHGDLLKVGR